MSQVSGLVSTLQQRVSFGDDLMFCSKDGIINEMASILAGHLVRGVSVVLFAFGVCGKVLYCLLRPGIARGEVRLVYAVLMHLLHIVELMSHLSTPLSSDAWSAFGAHNHLEHDQEVTKVTGEIQSKYIPEFCAKVNSYQLAITTLGNSYFFALTMSNFLPTERLRTEMHAHGINMRYLSQVRAMVTIDSLRNLIFASMITRAIKGLKQNIIAYLCRSDAV